ncbi:protoporphyrinogen oxidase [Hippea jasoniae]|uniref:protoporphyrinogen oxidase n=1 Tax=Hippea jasoniae TaxID=944479 RepID=UPI0005513D05|nr:protoporphyrinogen oxidase [Hippea jasoniae]
MRIAVVGGGVSGLSVAFLIKRYITDDVFVLEQSDIGGKAFSVKENGYLIETGPNGFLENREHIKKLVELSGFDKNIIQSNRFADKRFIYDGKLHLLPKNPLKLLFDDLLSLKDKALILKEPFVKPVFEDETVSDFVKRRLGKGMLDKLIGPMVCGVFAGDPEFLSMDENFSRIKQIERRYGSLIKGLVDLVKQKKARAGSTAGSFASRLLSFKNGVGSFVLHLAGRLNVVFDRVLSFSKEGGGYRLFCKNGDFYVDRVVFAIPAFELSRLFLFDVEFKRILDDIPYAPLSVVTLGFDRKLLPDIVNSFGYLFALSKINDVIGVLFDSSIFSNRSDDDKFLIRLMVGGALRKEAAYKKDLLSVALKELNRSAGIFAPPEFIKIIRHPMAIPQYGLKHKDVKEKIAEIEERFPNLYITGNAFFGVGLDDCIKASFEVLERIKAG